MELGKPTFIPVQDLEMGFEKIVKLAHARGGKLITEQKIKKYISLKLRLNVVFAVCKRQNVISKLKADVSWLNDFFIYKNKFLMSSISLSRWMKYLINCFLNLEGEVSARNGNFP